MIDTDKGEGHPCKWCGYHEDSSAWHYEDCPIFDDPMVKFHIDKNYEMQKEVMRLRERVATLESFLLAKEMEKVIE